jgi:hypothetical protein
MISVYDISLGHPKAFCVEKVSFKLMSTELAGDGGDTIWSLVEHVEDLAGKES